MSDKNKPLLLGISGVAKSGKDSLYKCLCNLYPHLGIERIAFADSLKGELSEIVMEHFGIDLFDMTPAKKELIRPLLVWWGCTKREILPDYWIDLAFADFNFYKGSDIVVVTDVRFDNERARIQEMGGKVIYLERLWFNTGSLEWEILKPCNEEEKGYTLPIKEKADFHFTWPDFETGDFNLVGGQIALKAFLEDARILK